MSLSALSLLVSVKRMDGVLIDPVFVFFNPLSLFEPCTRVWGLFGFLFWFYAVRPQCWATGFLSLTDVVPILYWCVEEDK